MFWKWNPNKQVTYDNTYLAVPEDDINEELKRKISQLEQLAEKYGTTLQAKYEKTFESQGKLNLRIWVARDIDGTESELLNSKNSLEKEYRSELAIDFEGQKHDEDFYAHTITLWHRSRGNGTLYDVTIRDLSSDIEQALLRTLS